MKLEEQSSIPYIRGLDGLRALAILLVLFDHWAPWKGVNDIFEFGRSGLLLFFILSGYLITTVLLTLREKVESGELKINQAFKIFYMRRVLRIFPLYLLVILIAAVVYKSVHRDFIYHLLFIQNFSAMWAPFLPAYENATHLWSLAVEEQFYVLWAPVVLLLVKRERMVKICFVAILISLIFKAWCASNHVYDTTDVIPRWTMVWFLRLNTIGNIDSLAIGCLVAIDNRYRLVNWNQGLGYQLKRIAIFLVIPIFILIVSYTEILGFRQALATGIYMVSHDLLIQIPFLLLLYAAIRGGGILLTNRLLVWIGKRSYGIYIWHQFIRHAAMVLSLKLFSYELVPKYSIMSFIIYLLATFFIAELSWRLIENPFLKYKTKWTRNYEVVSSIYNTRKEIVLEILKNFGIFTNIAVILSILSFLRFGFGITGFGFACMSLGVFFLSMYFIVRGEISRGYFNLEAMPLLLKKIFRVKIMKSAL